MVSHPQLSIELTNIPSLASSFFFTIMAPAQITSVKALAESPSMPVPPSFTCNNNGSSNIISMNDKTLITPNTLEIKEENFTNIPIIDVSLLGSTDPNQRAKVVHDIKDACLNWGIFMVVNHGVKGEQMSEMLEFCGKFFNLSEDEKKAYQGKGAMDPITYGTSVHGAPVGNLFLWRDFIKVQVHPKFHCPNKPLGFSEAMEGYCGEIREIVKSLLGGISESLGLEPYYLEKATNLESSFQIFAANIYPPCQQPESAMGIPPHTDHGLLTLLISNGVDGLQFLHNGIWMNANPPPGAFVVNVADQLEIMSNGKYKSCLHRAVVNSKTTRISIAVPNGPSADTIVGPIPELINEDGNSAAAYKSMSYMEYLELLFGRKLSGKSCLDHLKINA